MKTLKTFLLYAVTATDLMDAKSKLETALGISMATGDSEYYGIYYKYVRGPARLELQDNVDYDEEFEEGKGRVEFEFADVPLLLYVNSAEEVPDLVATLEANPEEFKRLRAKQV